MTHNETRISNERLAEMLAGAEGVTPGPWLSAFWPGSNSVGPDAGILSGPKMLSRDKSVLHTPSDAAHIARCDPDTIRAMIMELQELRANPSPSDGEVSEAVEVLRKLLIICGPEIRNKNQFLFERAKSALQPKRGQP